MHITTWRAEIKRSAKQWSTEHRAIQPASSRLENVGHPETGVRKPEQSGALFRKDFLEPAGEPVWTRRQYHRQSWWTFPVLEPLQGSGFIGAGCWWSCCHHGKCYGRCHCWTVNMFQNFAHLFFIQLKLDLPRSVLFLNVPLSIVFLHRELWQVSLNHLSKFLRIICVVSSLSHP